MQRWHVFRAPPQTADRTSSFRSSRPSMTRLAGQRHRGVVRNELADQRARETAESGRASASYLKGRIAVERSRDSQEKQGKECLPASRCPQSEEHSEAVASRFRLLQSGHAMVAIAFLKERYGWTDTDQCWWCNQSRQDRTISLKYAPHNEGDQDVLPVER